MQTHRGNYLNDEQKQVRQKIMEDCLNGLFDNLSSNQKLFTDAQSVIDLIYSVLVMFSRELLVNTLTATNSEHVRKDIMKAVFETIKSEVNRKIKERMM